MAAPNKEDLLRARGGFRSGVVISDDESMAVSAVEGMERYAHLKQPTGNDALIFPQIAQSFSASGVEHAQGNYPFAAGLKNEAYSYQRLSDDLAEHGHARVAVQVPLAVGRHGRIPDAAVAPSGNPADGVILREMKTKDLHDSREQLDALAGSIHQPPGDHLQARPATGINWNGQQMQVPVHGLEIDMRSHSHELTPENMGHLHAVAGLAGPGTVRARTKSMTSFEPIATIDARRVIHQS